MTLVGKASRLPLALKRKRVSVSTDVPPPGVHASTVQVAYCPLPSVAETVMVAVPSDSAVMVPSRIDATLALLVDQVTVLRLALAGNTVALTLYDWPTGMRSAVWSRVMLSTSVLPPTDTSIICQAEFELRLVGMSVQPAIVGTQ